MKLIILLMTVAILQISAATRAQNITMKKEKVSLRQVIKEIRQQSGYDFFYNLKLIQKAIPVTINIKDMPLEEALKKVFENQPLTYTVAIAEKAVVVTEKKEVPLLDRVKNFFSMPITVSGKVTDTTGTPLSGATLKIEGESKDVRTNKDGDFTFSAESGTEITVSFIGFQSYTFRMTNNLPFQNIVLHTSYNKLTEVTVSTGYQTLPKERETGSYDQIDNKLLNRNTGSNILDRLNGVTSGLRFNGLQNKSIATGSGNRVLGINIRGESTLSSNVSRDPLIVLDNFPYEGNISNINPNDIESISVLKDAAAASIWGARSGNGVIVITTKKGKRNQPLIVDINANVTIQNKPNMFWDRNFLKSSDYIDVESYLFKQGFFDNYLSDVQDQPAVSPVIDLLAKQRDGTISDAAVMTLINTFRNNDIRNDYYKYLGQKAIKQQYSIGMRGGTAQNSYNFSVGYDKNQDNSVRNSFDRLTINALNTYMPIRNLEITTGINYSQNTTLLNNQLGYGNGISVGGSVAGVYANTPYGALYPYAQLADPSGNHLSVIKNFRAAYANSAIANGFLNWTYKPLDELALGDNNTKVTDLLIKAAVKYKFTSFLNAEVQYQNEKQMVQTYNYQSAETYAARNLVNQFTIIDPDGGAPTYQIPQGGMLDLGTFNLISNNFRGQLSYDQKFNHKHNVTAIAGAEVRQLTNTGYYRNSLGYDDQFGTAAGGLDYSNYLNVNPFGLATIPSSDGGVTGTTNRFISYYANASYSYNDRYTATISGRKDGANIFGVKTNDKITPLWSAGLGWNIYNEEFYKIDWLPYLKARVSYGFNGNVYNGTAYVTGTYLTPSQTNIPAIYNLTAPNPDLRWEKVKNVNVGIDFATKRSILSGTIEFYQKNGQDLIENIPLYSSSGFTSFNGNAATTSTRGFDITLNSKNIDGKFKWGTTLLFSTLHDKVVSYNAKYSSTSFQGNGGNGIPVVGNPLYSMYSYKWAGLDPENGDPRGYLNGKISKDYTGIIGNYNPDSLVYNGSARPTTYGSLRNDFSYHNFELSFNIIYELGYVFRKSSTSLNYSDLIGASYLQNVDYDQRWQKPGDESHTNVPSLVYPSNPNRNTFYQYSQTLIDNGNNLRLQDIRLSYTLTKSSLRLFPFNSLQLYAYASNLGILWRANKDGLDPDLPYRYIHSYPNPFTLSLGFSIRL